MTNSLLLKPWPISFVDLPTKNMAIFHSCLCVYQRVYWGYMMEYSEIDNGICISSIKCLGQAFDKMVNHKHPREVLTTKKMGSSQTSFGDLAARKYRGSTICWTHLNKWDIKTQKLRDVQHFVASGIHLDITKLGGICWVWDTTKIC